MRGHPCLSSPPLHSPVLTPLHPSGRGGGWYLEKRESHIRNTPTFPQRFIIHTDLCEVCALASAPLPHPCFPRPHSVVFGGGCVVGACACVRLWLCVCMRWCVSAVRVRGSVPRGLPHSLSDPPTDPFAANVTLRYPRSLTN